MRPQVNECKSHANGVLTVQVAKLCRSPAMDTYKRDAHELDAPAPETQARYSTWVTAAWVAYALKRAACGVLR
jgi:hypothetical protein